MYQKFRKMTIQKKYNHYEVPHRLKILGVGASQSKALAANVRAALAVLEAKVILEEIEEIDKLMEFDISGIPALVLNSEILLQKQVPSVEALIELLRPLLKSNNPVIPS